VQVFEDNAFCQEAGCDGFDADSALELATLERLYGKNSAAAAEAAAKEASNIDDAEAPEHERQPVPAALALYIFMLQMFASLYLAVKAAESNGKYDYDKRWRWAFAGLSVVTGLLITSTLMIGRPQSDADWRDHKKYELLTRSVKGYESGKVQTIAYGDACYALAEHVPDGPKKNEEREKLLRKALTAYELDRLSEDLDTNKLRDAYNELAAILEEKKDISALDFRKKAINIKEREEE
jgi:hypothetical protein